MAETVKIDKKTITVRELTLREIKELTEGSGESPIDMLTKLMTISTSAKPADLIDLTPSEIQPFVDMVLQVNTPFFVMAKAANMKEMAEALQGMIRSVFLTARLPSLKEDTE